MRGSTKVFRADFCVFLSVFLIMYYNFCAFCTLWLKANKIKEVEGHKKGHKKAQSTKNSIKYILKASSNLLVATKIYAVSTTIKQVCVNVCACKVIEIQ